MHSNMRNYVGAILLLALAPLFAQEARLQKSAPYSDFIFVDSDTRAGANLLPTAITPWFGESAILRVTIQDIQTITDFNNDDSPLLGQTVTVEGIAATGPRSLWIEARWSFILADTDGGDFGFIQIVQNDTTVTATNITAIHPGDLVRVTGVVEEFSGGAPLYSQTQIALLTNPPVPVEILGSGHPLPTPTLLTAGEFASLETGERHESRRVRIENATILDRNLPNFNVRFADATGELIINP